MHRKSSFFNVLLIFSLFVFFSCATNEKVTGDEKVKDILEPIVEEPSAPAVSRSLTFVFAGDVMAHKPNYANGHFDLIWEDIKDFVSDSDFAFANIEAPVNDDIEWNTYPQFNMHSEYIEAVIDTGFNVFSLANNHTNDQFLKGIRGTKKYFENIEKESSGGERKIYASGLKDKASGPLTYRVLEKNGWKILFVAITELLNRNDAKEYIDYYPTSDKNHEFLISEMKRLKKENDCNFSIISVHTDEEEYVRAVTDSHKKFFRDLIEKAGVNIVWANHPHIVKKYETIAGGLVMYAMGNTISAQRTNPQWEKPETARDDTGDGIILKVKLTEKGLEISEPYVITTYIDPNGVFVIRHLDENLVNCFKKLNYKVKGNYFKRRLEITEKALK